VDVCAWRELWSTDRVEVTIAAVTMAGVVIVGVLDAIVFAVGLSIVDVVRRSASPHDAVLGWVEKLGRWGDVAVHPDARITPGIVVYRLDDRLFFANAGYVTGRVREALRGVPSEPRWLVLDAQAVTHVDAAGLAALTQLARSLQTEDVGLALARTTHPIEQQLEAGGVGQVIGPDRFYPTVRGAVEALEAAEAVRPPPETAGAPGARSR